VGSGGYSSIFKSLAFAIHPHPFLDAVLPGATLSDKGVPFLAVDKQMP